jgi:signal transduction histidine kinase
MSRASFEPDDAVIIMPLPQQPWIGQHHALQRKYDALQRTHGNTVKIVAEGQRTASDLHAMATWALRASPTGWAMVREGRLRLTNRAFDELDRDSAIGPRWCPLTSPGTDEPPGRSLTEIVVDEARLALELGDASRRPRFARGEQVVEVCLECPIASAADQSVVMVLVRDVSGLAQSEAKLAALQARLVAKERAGVVGELAVGVAHDLGNLVGALRARTMVLQRSAAEGQLDADSLQAIDMIVDAQAALVGKLKALGRPRAETPAPLDLVTEVVEPAVQMVESWLRVRSRQHPVVIWLDGSLTELPPVSGLRDELVNLVINLFLNARDAMPDGGRISVSGRREGDAVILLVEDEGTGVPAEHLARIFDPFFSTKGAGGTGMGLAMARELMHRLRGTIEARNRAGRGTCFELRFRPASP